MIKTAIVILNYNGSDLLRRFLPSVCKYSNQTNTEIIVADNHSSDASIEFLSKNFPNIRRIVLEKNWGFAEGYNRALAQINAEYYVLLNSDVEVTENWLSIIEFLDKNPEFVACQPKIKDWKNKTLFEYAGACGGFIDRFGYPYCRGRIFNKIESDSQQYDTPIEVFWATGACLAIRSKAFNECHGFDKNFFAHMEEIDLCWRLQYKGLRVACYPQSVVYHVGAKTLNQKNPTKIYLNFRNNLLMLYKNLPDNQIHKVFLVRFFFDYAIFFWYLLSLHFGKALAVFKARFHFNRMKKLYDRKNAPTESLNNIFNSSIIVLFYLYRRTKFSDLHNKKREKI